MDQTHIHLLLNHFPIIGTLIGFGVMVWGLLRNQKSTTSVAAVIVITMTLMAIPVYLTGEPAEERVEHLPGISETAVEEHEDAAKLAMIAMAVAGVAALGSLLMQYRSESKLPFGITAVLTLVAFLAMARVGYLGGQIRHTELQTGQQASQQQITNEYEEEHED